MALYIFMTELTWLLQVLYRIFCPSQFLVGGKENKDFMELASRGKKNENKALVKLLFMNTDSKIQSLNSKK